MTLHDQFIENARDVHLWGNMKKQIEEDGAVSFLALQKVTLKWSDDVEERSTLANASYDQIVGEVPIAKVTVAGQPADCLLDTSSQVSFVTESFYDAVLRPQGHMLHSACNCIRAADGLEIPYVRYFVTTVCFGGI